MRGNIGILDDVRSFQLNQVNSLPSAFLLSDVSGDDDDGDEGSGAIIQDNVS